MKTLRVIDSHTGGEPTRVVMDGFPALNGTTMEKRLAELQQQDQWRRAVMLEPRGNDVLVGALYCPPVSEDASCGVIFFNNAGYLGMCGHGTIGLVHSLHYLGLMKPGRHKIDTPVGQVEITLHEDGSVTICNVLSYRYRHDVEVDVPGYGRVKGDIGWGGNWFFLVSDHSQRININNVEALTDFTWAIRQGIEAAGITGENGGVIDHIELFADDEDGISRNFVLCPGKAYDRSPCGTGTSAKLACLAAAGKLEEGGHWLQRSITGSEFEGYYHREGDMIRPFITGRANLTADASLLIDETDSFAWGITPH